MADETISLAANANALDGGLAAPLPLRLVDRWQNGLWSRVAMRDLRAGDVFRVDDVRGEFTAASDAYKRNEDGFWSVEFFNGDLPHGISAT